MMMLLIPTSSGTVVDQLDVPDAEPDCDAVDHLTAVTATLSRAVPLILICAALIVIDVPTGELIASVGVVVSAEAGGVVVVVVVDASVTVTDFELVLPSRAFTSTTFE